MWIHMELERIKKLIALRKHESLDIQEYNLGLVIINNKFVVSLIKSYLGK